MREFNPDDKMRKLTPSDYRNQRARETLAERTYRAKEAYRANKDPRKLTPSRLSSQQAMYDRLVDEGQSEDTPAKRMAQARTAAKQRLLNQFNARAARQEAGAKAARRAAAYARLKSETTRRVIKKTGKAGAIIGAGAAIGAGISSYIQQKRAARGGN